ncbi:MAG TPA: sigma-54 dependent transcriptional regulator [Candidatus Aminicenantes bacterium]|nr:sigma-54 dependent transcriptional regulator [Candidatus Aminicenantes bacterium]
MSRILFVDDDPSMRQAMALVLIEHELQQAAGREEALALLKNEPFALLLTDLFMPGREEGLDLVEAARALDSDLFIAVLTGFGTVAAAVEAMKRGADDFLSKEFTPEGLRLQVEKFLRIRQERIRTFHLEEENRLLRRDRFAPDPLIGDSPPMAAVKKSIALAAADDSGAVLILGKSGTGKELAARQVHERSRRRSQPFMPIDCPALPENLFESELFGHERGAFTDARERKLGRVELAHRGTLYLDEIADLPRSMQAKLLRFLETGEFFRIGASRPQHVDVRIISSTNRDLTRLVHEGHFRDDLYYRLRVVEITMPDLGQRGEDLIRLAEHFLAASNSRKGIRLSFSDEDKRLLRAHDWPGNVRELRNAVDSFAILGKLPIAAGEGQWAGLDYRRSRSLALADFERRYLQQALARQNGNITRAAREIGLSREELSRKAKKLGL